MKHIMLVTLFFVITLSQFNSAQIPRIISYQGILTDNAGNPKPDGDYSITFSFYELEAGGDAIWSESKTLALSKGLFSTSLADKTPFGVEVKFDKPYWLGIKVGDEAELSPRIALTSAGYSFSSDVALNIIDGKVVKSLNTLKDDITIEGSGGTTINSNGNTITISSSGTGGTGIQGVQNTNNTIDVINPNGPTATVNVKVPLALDGVANGNNYLFTAKNTGSGHGIIGTSVSGYGSVGIASGNTGPTAGVVGNSSSPDGNAVSGWNLATTGYSIGVVGRTSSPAGIGVRGFGGQNGFGVWGSSTNNYGIYGEGVTGVFGAGGLNGVWGFTGQANGTGVLGTSFLYGVKGSSAGTVGSIGVFGEVTSNVNDVRGVYGKTISPQGNGIVGENFATTGGGRGVWGLSHSPDGVGIFGDNLDPNGWAGYFNGKVAVKTLQINGGSDLAEPFEISEFSEIELGSVMIIDDKNPGKLKLSTEAYDKKVAGIVSGAGGIKPGITLQQDGILEGNILVAIGGKVYCKVEALSGPIKAGDLLTTSHIPGYAMKVTDKELSQGTVIGKAMTELESGKGLVLVLVNLQ